MMDAQTAFRVSRDIVSKVRLSPPSEDTHAITGIATFLMELEHSGWMEGVNKVGEMTEIIISEFKRK